MMRQDVTRLLKAPHLRQILPQERIGEAPVPPPPAFDDGRVAEGFQGAAHSPARLAGVDGLLADEALGDHEAELVQPADPLDGLFVDDPRESRANTGARGR
jgi:hypothetical protein